MSEWTEAQEWEKAWHLNCVNSYGEETKQLTYAKKMGLKLSPNEKTPYNYNLGNVSVLDVGGGPYSITLKCIGFSNALVVDPCDYPNWTMERYKESGINYVKGKGEDILNIPEISGFLWSETWLYNVLQHTEDPALIIKNIMSISKLIRIFEWIDMPISPGHPQVLTEKDLNKWLGGNGKVENINENGCVGKCYYGIFKGNHYDK